VFPVRYGLNIYILFIRNSVFKRIIFLSFTLTSSISIFLCVYLFRCVFVSFCMFARFFYPSFLSFLLFISIHIYLFRFSLFLSFLLQAIYFLISFCSILNPSLSCIYLFTCFISSFHHGSIFIEFISRFTGALGAMATRVWIMQQYYITYAV
jgi:hypothetical protein